MLGTAIASAVAGATLTTAIITTDTATLRAAPRDGARQQAVLRQGEMVEVRGERLDYLQVYDHQRERAGFVRASQVRRTALGPAEAPELLTVLRFVKDQPGQEALGIGLAAAWLQAAPAPMVQGEAGAEALEALGTLADRLAQRASTVAVTTTWSGAFPGKAAEAAVAAQLDVARRYGVRFASYEHDGRMQVCYDGAVFLRLMALPASPTQMAQAALGLTRPECVDPALLPLARAQLTEWRTTVLDRVDTAALPAHLANRVWMRRAGLWAALAWHQTRQGQDGAVAARRAIDALAAVQPGELPDSDRADYNTAAMRVNASRWAAQPVPATPAPTRRAQIVTSAGQPGETCVALVDARHDAANPLARRCTWGTVWAASATLNREGNALALAVQPLDGWRELWLFRRQGEGWQISVLPPAPVAPGVGYAEFAGWVPGGQQMLVAREARGDGQYRRSFEVLSLDSLTPTRQASEPDQLGPFQRWPDAQWKRESVSVRQRVPGG